MGLQALLHREAGERDLSDEVSQFMAAAEAELIRDGSTPEDALRPRRGELVYM